MNKEERGETTSGNHRIATGKHRWKKQIKRITTSAYHELITAAFRKRKEQRKNMRHITKITSTITWVAIGALAGVIFGASLDEATKLLALTLLARVIICIIGDGKNE